MMILRKMIEKKKQHTKTLGVGVYLDDKNSCPKQKARDEEEEKSRRSPRNRRLYRRHFFFVRLCDDA